MDPLRDISYLQPGDVLHHVTHGLALVEAVDEPGRRVHLGWPGGRTGPTTLTDATRSDAWQVCSPSGFLSTSVRAPDLLRALVESAPFQVLRMLLRDLGRPVAVNEIRSRLEAAHVLSGNTFDAWWEGLLPGLVTHPSLRWDGARLEQDEELEPPVPDPGLDEDEPLEDEDTFSPFGEMLSPVELLSVSPFPIGDITVERPMDAGDILLTKSGPLPAHRIVPLSIDVARALASRHAAGETGGLIGARLRAGRAVELGPTEDSQPTRDVRDAMRIIVELAVGKLPPSSRLEDAWFINHLAQLVPGLPADWVAVMTRAMSPDPSLRPVNGLDLWSQLERAAATDRVRSMAPPRPRARFDVAHDTHIGALKSRLGQVNQDAVFWYTEGSHGLLIVADGISVSTAGSGDLASSILVRVVVTMWEQHQDRLADADTDECRAWLEAALGAANQAICNASLRLAGGDLSHQIPMGTTALVALTQGATVHLATLGDSRAFLISDSGAAVLNGDQNVRGEWMMSWQRGQPMDLQGDGHALTGYCGHFNEDLRPFPVPPAHRTVTMLPGDVLLLSSDGLTDYAAQNNAAMAAIIEDAAHTESLPEAARSLTAAANAGGGGDNITVLLARLTES